MASETSDWVECGTHLLYSDVICWTDPIWPERKRRRKKGKGGATPPHGEQRVTAQVLEVDSREYVRLLVIKAEITKNTHGMPLKAFKKDDIVVKKRATIMRGNPERLKWIDEAHRSAEISKFLS